MTSPVLLTPALALLLAAAAVSPGHPAGAPSTAPLSADPGEAQRAVLASPAPTPAVPAFRAGVASPAVAVAAGAPPGSSSAPTRLRAAWAWPLTPQPSVVRPFIRPASRWGAGHRGVDLAGELGQSVRAVAGGTVSHVGVVAGRGTVSVLHPSGIRSTYEPVDPAVEVGQVLAEGTALGTLETTGSHCTPAPCLHLGALRGRSYLDPLVLLLGGRVRLLPMR